MGADRPGIVSPLSERAQRLGANWAASRLARAGRRVCRHGALRSAARQRRRAGDGAARAGVAGPARRRRRERRPASRPPGCAAWNCELVGDDRLGIVSTLTRILAERGVSIENIHTEIVTSRHGPAQLQGGGAPAGAGRAVERTAARRARRAGARDDARHGAGRPAERLIAPGSGTTRDSSAAPSLSRNSRNACATGGRRLLAAMHQVPVQHHRKTLHVEHDQAAVAQLAADGVGRQEG